MFNTTNPLLRKNIFFLYLIFWQIIGFLCVVLFHFVYMNSYLNSIIDASILSESFMIIGISLWYPTKFFQIERTKVSSVIVNQFGSAIFVSFVWVGIGKLLHDNFVSDDSFFDDTIIYRFIIGIFLYIIYVSIFYLIIYYENYQQKLVQESNLKSVVTESELRSLKYQINPHFIFNCLNSISSLTIGNPEKAQEMTIKLSEFLRQSLSTKDKNMTTISEELKNCNLYLEIEKIRFMNKLEYSQIVDENCLDMKIPLLILQPLFENAVKYGVYGNAEITLIKFTCNLKGDYVRLSLENNYDPDYLLRKSSTGIGIKNIKERLKLLYNDNNLLTVNQTENQFTVTIDIPSEDING